MTDFDRRVLIVAPYGRDAAVIGQVLAGESIVGWVCPAAQHFAHLLAEGAACAIVTEESLSDLLTVELIAWLEQQPPWSDFPFIVLATRQTGRRSAVAQQNLFRLGNHMLLERPVNAQTLSSAASSAVRARSRQYITRGHLNDIRETERRLRLALEAARLGAWDIELAGMTMNASETCATHFGIASLEPLAYEVLLSSLDEEDVPVLRDAIARSIADGSDFDIECRTRSDPGPPRWLQVRGQAILGAGGHAERIVGVSTDITARRNAERDVAASRAAVEQLNAELEGRIALRTGELARANDRLHAEIAERERVQAVLIQSQKMEAMGQLVGGMAHDFNNLLHVISMNLELLSRFSQNERVQSLVGQARNAATRGSRLTTQLLAFARNQTLNPKTVDVNALVGAMEEILNISIGPAVPVTLQVEPAQALAVVDANQLEMAILNLALNARDALGASGSIAISAATRELTDGSAPSGHYVVVSVRDDGVGIPEDLLNKVFDPFFTTKPTGKGTGLGLSQVYGFARQSGGFAQIRSAVGQGTVVEIWLPAAAAGAAVIGVREAEPTVVLAADPKRILVVEDDAAVRKVIVDCLQLLGYSVREAPNGRAGLKILDDDVPDLLIVDYAMPDMTGADVIAQVRTVWPDLPVILATGYADMQAVGEVLGTDSILIKPFEVAVLSEAVRHSLASAHTESRSTRH